jgi:hypothetical protein
MKSKRTIPTLSIEAQELIRRLLRASVGDVISYAELSVVAMGDVQDQKRGVLTTARKRVLEDHDMVFEAISNVGLKRLNDEEIVITAEAPLVRINRLANRGKRKLACVDYDNLENELKIKYNARGTLLAFHYHSTKPRQLKSIEQKVEKLGSQLGLQQTLRAFGMESAEDD